VTRPEQETGAQSVQFRERSEKKEEGRVIGRSTNNSSRKKRRENIG